MLFQHGARPASPNPTARCTHPAPNPGVERVAPINAPIRQDGSSQTSNMKKCDWRKWGGFVPFVLSLSSCTESRSFTGIGSTWREMWWTPGGFTHNTTAPLHIKAPPWPLRGVLPQQLVFNCTRWYLMCSSLSRCFSECLWWWLVLTAEGLQCQTPSFQNVSVVI